MNIFVLDKNPRLAAEYHCDKHVVKMIVETAQLLSSAHHSLKSDIDKNLIYKPSHINNPCSIWTRESLSNYHWLLNLGFELVEEYEKRYKKYHKTKEVLKNLKVVPINISNIGLTKFHLSMPDEYKTNDPVQSYRIYYKKEKNRFATWKFTNQPWWW